jgi:hypothetical protein
MSLMRTCTKYFLQKTIEEFPWKNRLLGKRHTVCKGCYKERSHNWYEENKEAEVSRLMGRVQLLML